MRFRETNILPSRESGCFAIKRFKAHTLKLTLHSPNTHLFYLLSPSHVAPHMPRDHQKRLLRRFDITFGESISDYIICRLHLLSGTDLTSTPEWVFSIWQRYRTPFVWVKHHDNTISIRSVHRNWANPSSSSNIDMLLLSSTQLHTFLSHPTPKVPRNQTMRMMCRFDITCMKFISDYMAVSLLPLERLGSGSISDDIFTSDNGRTRLTPPYLPPARVPQNHEMRMLYRFGITSHDSTFDQMIVRLCLSICSPYIITQRGTGYMARWSY